MYWVYTTNYKLERSGPTIEAKCMLDLALLGGWSDNTLLLERSNMLQMLVLTHFIALQNSLLL
jgi:hypothetical protein